MVKFWRVLEKDLRSPVPYVVWFLLTVLFGLSGPFGSYEVLPLLPRVAFWAVGTALSIWAALAIRALVYGGLGLKKFRDGAVLTAVLVCLVLTGPLLVVVDRFLSNSLRHMPTLAEVAIFVFATTLGIGAFRHSLAREFRLSPPEEKGDDLFAQILADDGGVAVPGLSPEPPRPRLLDRLPEDLRDDLVSLQVRDHYVDVETTRGRTSLLMRFSDAIAEADGAEGDQVHRSHWVAWAHVERVEKTGGKLFVVLNCGRRVPVSRNYRDRLADRGLI